MYWIPTTIKRKYLDKILAGKKTIEQKVDSDHWRPRMERAAHELANDRAVGTCFLCGRQVVKYKVNAVSRGIVDTGKRIQIDEVLTQIWWDIHLGDQIQ